VAYTYFLYNKITDEKYYGARYACGCNPKELWITYFSSSKLVTQRIQEYGKSSFEFEVRKVFTTAKEARDWEERVLRRLDVLHRDDWLNQNICGKFLKDGPKPLLQRQKISKALKGRKKSEVAKRRMRAFWATHRHKCSIADYVASAEERQRISERMQGNTHAAGKRSEEFREKRRNFQTGKPAWNKGLRGRKYRPRQEAVIDSLIVSGRERH